MTRAIQELAAGKLGPVLLLLERGEVPLARRLLSEAIASGVSVGLNASLFHGAPALEFVLRCAQQTNHSLEDAVDAMVVRRLAAAQARQQAGRLPALSEFDLIQGLTGLGVVLLARPARAGRGKSLLRNVLTYLTSLAQPTRNLGDDLPGWWCDTGPDGKELPGGHGNNGMAHGIAGPLALLCLAQRQGLVVPGQLEAIAVFACWLQRFGATYWVTRLQALVGRLTATQLLRPSWCYGAMGIARARQLAALALRDNDQRQRAEDLAYQALTTPTIVEYTVDSGLCHGWAGLLQVSRAIAADSSAPTRFDELGQSLAARTAAGLDALPSTELMVGRPGAELALLDSNTSGWTRLLLID